MNKTKLMRVLAIALSLCMMLTFLTACSTKPTPSSSSSSSSSSDDSANISDESSSPETEFGGSEDISSEEPASEEATSSEEEVVVNELKVFNNKAPLITNYRGVSSSVYHGSTYMKDKFGRDYTEEMAQLEFNRLQDAGIRSARTFFKSQWVWDSVKKEYNWNSDRIKDFYKWAEELQKRGIKIILSIGWHFDNPVAKDMYTDGINEVPYIYGHEPGLPSKYGELSLGYNTEGMSADDKRLSETGLRFGEFAKQAIENCRARGINNISSILPFTEPSGRTTDAIKAGKLEGLYAAQYLTVAKAIKYSFRRAGNMNDIKIIGPNQGSVDDGEGLLRYVAEREPDLFDIYSAHFYPTGTSETDDVYGDLCSATFGSYMDVVKRYNLSSNQTGNKKEFWVDEFYARSEKQACGVPNSWCGLQTGVGILTAMKFGIQNVSLWQIFDQLWVDQTNTAGEFTNGIHAVGSAPSLLVSSIPHPQYYPVSLLGKYLGSQNGKVYESYSGAEEASGIYMGSVQLEDGNWTIAIINANSVDSVTVRVTMDKAINKTLYRHLYNANLDVPTTAARLPDADRSFKDVKKIIKDTIPSGGVAVYTSLKY